MRKLVTCFVVLFLLCSIGVTASAESSVQTIEVGCYSFEVPSTLSIAMSFSNGNKGSAGITDWYSTAIQIEVLGQIPDHSTTNETEEEIQYGNFPYIFSQCLPDRFVGDSQYAYYDLETSNNEGVIVATLSDYQSHQLITILTYYGENSFCIFEKGTFSDRAVSLDRVLSIARSAFSSASQQYVIITCPTVNIRSGPDGSAAKITTARQGDTFPLIGEDGNWYVIDVNGQTGYVTKSLSAIQ